jgi:hypothetical protein
LLNKERYSLCDEIYYIGLALHGALDEQHPPTMQMPAIAQRQPW